MMAMARQQMRMMPVAVRSIHQRGYNNFDDFPIHNFHEINMQLANCKHTDNFMFIYEKFDGKMTPEQIMYGFRQIAALNLERTEDFWKKIVPTVKKQLSTLDRKTYQSITVAIEAASRMRLQDNEFWEIVEQKLVDEGLHRYFSLEDLTRVMSYLSLVGRGSDDMIEIVEKTLIKHRKGLTPQTIAIAKDAFARVNKGSEILQRVLEDPKTELPALE